MTPERVSYQKTFNLGSYQSERIGIDMLLDATDNPEEALLKCKAMVESFHTETVPVVENPPIMQVPHSEAPIISKDEQIKNAILSCEELKVLESYRLIVKNKPELKEIYDQQHQKLTKKLTNV